MKLGGSPGELRISVTVKRKETGKVETYDLVGTTAKDLHKEQSDVSNAPASNDSGSDGRGNGPDRSER